MRYNRSDWYWIAGDRSDVYSSSRAEFVSVSDATYLDWLEAGGIPTRIAPPDLILIQIDILEQSVTPRRLREAVLGTDDGWLDALNGEIAALRAQL